MFVQNIDDNGQNHWQNNGGHNRSDGREEQVHHEYSDCKNGIDFNKLNPNRARKLTDKSAGSVTETIFYATSDEYEKVIENKLTERYDNKYQILGNKIIQS